MGRVRENEFRERHGRCHRILCAALFFVCVFLPQCRTRHADNDLVLRIQDWNTGELYAEAPAKVGSRLFFGWIHSLEKIPWNEYYHIDVDHNLILDAITFPAFGAGIPEDKGGTCRVRDGLIHMENIDQLFPELVWLNSHFATREIMLDDSPVTTGSELPQHTRMRLVIERRQRQ